jgi:hypothetical protein
MMISLIAALKLWFIDYKLVINKFYFFFFYRNSCYESWWCLFSLSFSWWRLTSWCLFCLGCSWWRLTIFYLFRISLLVIMQIFI